jgi:hypothetical protein
MRSILWSVPVLAGLLLSGSIRAEDKPSAFLKPDNWEGLMEHWKIEGTTVVGFTPKDGLKFNTFLCSKKKYKDFELKCQVRLLDGKGNSGIQVRSEIANPKTFAVKGPQCDIADGYWGSLYGELFGGMMKAADKKEVDKVLKPKDFNDYHIKCVGKHLTITLNGLATVDQEFEKMPAEGIIAWQIHGGLGYMEVTFKNIEFKELK